MTGQPRTLTSERASQPPLSGRSKVYIIIAHALLRKLLSDWLNTHSDLVVCGEAADSARALKGIGREKPDLVIVDLSHKNSHGIDLVKNLRVSYPRVRILALSVYEEDLLAHRVLRAGADGYVSRELDPPHVLTAIRSVLRQQLYVSEQLAVRILKHTLGRQYPSSSLGENLSDREFQVMQLTGEGYAPRDIAHMLKIDVRTVATYRIRLRDKLNLSSMSDLTRYAVQWRQSESSLRRRSPTATTEKSN